jgi:hypothetical protein
MVRPGMFFETKYSELITSCRHRNQDNIYHGPAPGRTPLGRDLYEKNSFSQLPFYPPRASTTTGVKARLSSQPISHPIEPTFNISTSSEQVHSKT